MLLEKLNTLASLIGRTPTVKLERVVPPNVASIYVKLESMNPGGSHKDRIAYYMLREAVKKRLLAEDSYVIEVSSGNTALSLAWMSARLGLKAAFVVEEEMSEAKVAMLKLLGAEVIKVKLDGFKGEDPRFAKARELEERLGGVFMNQFSNEANFRAHYETTAREIVEQMKGEIHAFVMGIGTGGTIAGVGKYLKEELGGNVLIVGIIPTGSALLHGKAVGEDRIEGLTKDIVPDIYTRYGSYIDKVVELSKKEAVNMVKRLAREEGLLVGPSTGAAVIAAIEVAREFEPITNVVTVAADSIFGYSHMLKT